MNDIIGGEPSAEDILSVQEEVKTLTSLGLTLCQAKVYISLIRIGTSTAKTIS